jgi:hypothetical protein
MAVLSPALRVGAPVERVRATVELLECRGYAVAPARLGELCLGGPLPERAVREAALHAGLGESQGLVLTMTQRERAAAIAARAAMHEQSAAVYLPETLRFVRRLVELAPFVVSVAIAGSLASGGFMVTDDVDLNLVVEDGYRHQAYVALNLLGLAHALRHRSKPVDDLSRRPVAPRLMTANLILERSDFFPLVRQDAAMAFELLVQEPVFGGDFLRDAVAANPALAGHFPQLLSRQGRWSVTPGPRLPRHVYPRWLERPARSLGAAGWRYMMWTRRHRPEALHRVELVRRTMRPYALFDSR